MNADDIRHAINHKIDARDPNFRAIAEILEALLQEIERTNYVARRASETSSGFSDGSIQD